MHPEFGPRAAVLLAAFTVLAVSVFNVQRPVTLSQESMSHLFKGACVAAFAEDAMPRHGASRVPVLLGFGSRGEVTSGADGP